MNARLLLSVTRRTNGDIKTACLQYCTVEQYGHSHVLIHIFFSLNISQESVSRRTSILCGSVTIAIAAYILVNCYFIKTVSDGRGRRTIVCSTAHTTGMDSMCITTGIVHKRSRVVIFDILLHRLFSVSELSLTRDDPLEIKSKAVRRIRPLWRRHSFRFVRILFFFYIFYENYFLGSKLFFFHVVHRCRFGFKPNFHTIDILS